jgi:metal transporter CNNM
MLKFYTIYQYLMSEATILVEVLILVMLSAVCSGLNVAFMSLDIADLRRQAKLGNKAAKKVLPLRRNAHLSLASILLTNVAVISATSLVLDRKFNGLIAGIASTLLIVVFGEAIPQAFFTRHALKFTARLAPLLRFMIVATYIASKPLQILLDRLIGKQRIELESRQELGIIIAEHARSKRSELDEGEIEIIRGALSLSQKRVRDIMVDIGKVYWLEPDTIIDGEKIDEIKRSGHSRIPIFNGHKTKCYGVLLVKDLVDVDFDEEEVRVEDLPLHPTTMVGSMTALDTIFKKFLGSYTHLLPVERSDKIVGIITAEDLLEEIIGHEIEDEFDRPRLKLSTTRKSR